VQAAGELNRRLPPGAYLVASDEPKAWQTLDPDGERGVPQDARLREVRRTEEFNDNFRRVRRSYVTGAVIPGWEPQTEGACRFGAAIEAAADAAGGRHVVPASHGMAMTVWLTKMLPLADPGSFWAELRFPDVLLADLRAGTVTRPNAR
jgi:broad specificity phosphatase PhoE